jgi:hypothetical protein
MCNLKHEWQGTVNGRTNQQSGCPFCAGKYLSEDNRLSVRFPEIASEWHPAKNRKLRTSIEGSWNPTLNFHLSPEERSAKNRKLLPSDVSYGSKQLIWWQCKLSKEHVWQASVCNRTRGSGCPFCGGLKVAKDNCLSSRYPGLAKQWHPTRNNPLLPTEITSGSGKKVWWRCFKSAKHVWQAPVTSIIRSWMDGHNGCPFCKGIRVTDDSNLIAKFPKIAKNFHPTRNQRINPAELSPGSNQVIWWKCPKSPDHDWEAPVYSVVESAERGSSGCPFCAGHKACEQTSLAGQYPKIAIFWHPTLNQPVGPSDVLPHSNKSFWWRCPNSDEHVWHRKVNEILRTWKTGVSLCPYCSTSKQSKRIINRALQSDYDRVID